MMDDSDGIALSLYDLLGVNECGFSLTSDRIPRRQVSRNRRQGNSPSMAAGTMSRYLPSQKTATRSKVFLIPVIGEVIAKKVVLVDGVAPARRGYQHHWT